MHLRSWFVGVSRQVAKLRKQRSCGHWWRRGAGLWAHPSDHQVEITSSPGRMSLLCSKETIVPPINGRDSMYKTNFQFHYLLLILISEALATLIRRVCSSRAATNNTCHQTGPCYNLTQSMDDLVIPSRDTNGSLFDPQQNLEPRTPTIEPEQISTKRAPEMWQMTFNTSQIERSPWMPTILSFYNGRRHHRLPDPLGKHAATREVADPDRLETYAATSTARKNNRTTCQNYERIQIQALKGSRNIWSLSLIHI